MHSTASIFIFCVFLFFIFVSFLRRSAHRARNRALSNCNIIMFINNLNGLPAAATRRRTKGCTKEEDGCDD